MLLPIDLKRNSDRDFEKNCCVSCCSCILLAYQPVSFAFSSNCHPTCDHWNISRPTKFPIQAVANGEVKSGVISKMEPIKPSRRLTFTVRRCQLPGAQCYLVAHRTSAVSPCLYINNASPTVAPASTGLIAHSGGFSSTQNTPTRITVYSPLSNFEAVNMAPHTGHGARRSAHRTAHEGKLHRISSANNTQPYPQGHRTLTRRDGDRARQAQRKRNRGEREDETRPPRSPSPAVLLRHRGRLTDRMTYNRSDAVRGPVDYGESHDPPPRPQQGRSLQSRITRETGYNRTGGAVQPVEQRGAVQDQVVNTNTDESRYDMCMDVEDDFQSLFGSEPPSRTSTSLPPYQPVNTKPVQYGSSHDLPFNLHLHPPRPVQPATSHEPIRIITSWAPHEPDIDGPLETARPAIKSPAVGFPAGRPVNTYRGKDPIKRLVRNEKLQRILAGQGLPKPRKRADRMDLKCAGGRIYR